VNAWQHPIERCRACGQDILLRPEITQDLRMVYVRHCPGCGPAPAAEDADLRDQSPRGEPGRGYGGIVGYEATVGGDLWGDDDEQQEDMDARWAAFAARAEREEQPLADEPSEGTFMFAVEDRGRRRFRLPLIQRLRQPA
jgi:hypothetical protein